MTIQEMCEKKRELGYSYEQIAELANLPLSTVQKVMGGVTKSPRYDTLKALEEVFLDKKDKFSSMAADASPYMAVKKQGEYTIEDYLALPDETRVELIDGVFYDMAAPTDIHQLLCGELHALFREHIRKNKGRCVPMLSPFDVQLDCDDKTMLQPDLMIICQKDKFINRGRLYGAPDLVVEILSPSTKRKDMVIKNHKYMNAGVREYWMVDPKKKRIMVYRYEDADMVEIYTFDDEVPVGIFNNECKINFSEIYEYIEFLYTEDGREV